MPILQVQTIMQSYKRMVLDGSGSKRELYIDRLLSDSGHASVVAAAAVSSPIPILMTASRGTFEEKDM